MLKSSFMAVIPLLLALSATVAAQPKDKAEKAREHYTQGEMYMQAGVYDLAVKEYREGYKLAPKAHGFLFNIGLAYEKMGDKKKAVEAYERYLEVDGKGKKAPEARARAVALRRQLDAEQVVPPSSGDDDPDGPMDPDDEGDDDDDTGDRVAASGGRPGGDDIVDPGLGGPSDRAPPPAKSGPSWGFIAAGLALVAGGVAADLLPGSSKNGELDALDFLPVGLYVGGGLLVWRGAF